MRIASIFMVALLASACGSAVGSHVRTAAEAGDAPDDFVVTYDDHHPRWGGERIVLRGDGSLSLVRYRPGQGTQTAAELTGQVPAEAVRDTLELLAAIEAWEQRAEEEAARLDDAKARLTIEIGGDRSSIWEWANDLQTNERIVRVKQQLEALAVELRHPMIDEAGGPPITE